MRRAQFAGSMSIARSASAIVILAASALTFVPFAAAAARPSVSSGPITLDGTPVAVTLSSGQNGTFTFSGTSGRGVSVNVTQSTIGPDCPAVVIALLRPNSSQLGSSVSTCGANAFLDAQTLDATGTWTILVDPQGSASGHLTLQAYAVTDQTSAIVRNGVSVPVSITTPGQNARFTFSSSAGQQVSAYLSNATFGVTCKVASISLVRPNGTTLGAPARVCKHAAFLDSQTLDATGTWTVLVDPNGPLVGTGGLQAFNTNDVTGLAHTDGSAFAIQTVTPGQNALIHFSGTAGQQISALVTSATFSGCTAFKLALVHPNGTPFGSSVSSCNAAAFLDAQTLDQTGVWNVRVDPQGMTMGNASLAVYDASVIAKPINLNGAPVNAALVPGQVAEYSFSGTNGQQVSAEVTGSTINGCPAFALSLMRPNGTTLGSAVNGCNAEAFLDSHTLDANGTWNIVIDPIGANQGSATLNGYTFADDNGVADLTGKPVNLNFTKPGQNAEWTFSGSTGQKISAYVTGSTLSGCDFTLSLVRPNGNVLGSPVDSCATSAFLDTQTLDANGTWTVVVDPQQTNVGNATLQVFEIVDEALPFKPGKALKTFTVLSPGENALYTFAGHVGDKRTVSISGSTYEGCPAVVVAIIRPNQTVLTSTSTCGKTLSLANLGIDADGTWTLFIDPQGPATGTMIIRLT
jgi:hypothetical protein